MWKELDLTERPATRLYIPQAARGRRRGRARRRAGASVAPRAAARRRAPRSPAFNERDGEWLCRLDASSAATGRSLIADAAAAPGRAREPDLWLLFAPIKRARLDWLVEKATELGAAALAAGVDRAHPAGAPQPRTGCARWRLPRPSRASACRCRRSPPRSRSTACSPPGPPGGGSCCATRPAPACRSPRRSAGFPPDAPAALLVGPEGGFTERELDALGKLPIVTRVGLGPRVLRAETAALAALAVFQAIAGDWRRRRPR